MNQEDGIDRDKLVIMALIHDITDFRPWDGVQQSKFPILYSRRQGLIRA